MENTLSPMQKQLSGPNVNRFVVLYAVAEAMKHICNIICCMLIRINSTNILSLGYQMMLKQLYHRSYSI